MNYNQPRPEFPVARPANELRKGHVFLSDRAAEGTVECLEDYGHYTDRPEAVYVRERGTTGDGIWSASWFVTIMPNDIVHCEE